jgi:fumarate reductase subunit C
VSARGESVLWIAQRASAVVLGVCAMVHLAVIIYAVQGGLSAAEILGRTRGNGGWFVFYSLFVLGIVVHVPIGLRAILIEWLGWRGRSRTGFLLVFTALLAWMGMRAVVAVFS